MMQQASCCTTARRSSVRRHTNVLQHAMGYFKEVLASDERRRVHDVIEEYRCGLVPLVVPVTLLRHYVQNERVEYLAEQTYFDPTPRALMLRNHVMGANA